MLPTFDTQERTTLYSIIGECTVDIELYTKTKLMTVINFRTLSKNGTKRHFGIIKGVGKINPTLMFWDGEKSNTSEASICLIVSEIEREILKDV